METHIPARHAESHYETDLQNMVRTAEDSFHGPAKGKGSRPRCLSKKGREKSFCMCPTEGRLLRDTTDEGWEKPVSICAAAEVKGNPSHSHKFRHRSQGARSAPAKESTVATHIDFQGLHGRASNSFPPTLLEDAVVSKSTREGGTAASRKSGGDTSPAG